MQMWNEWNLLFRNMNEFINEKIVNLYIHIRKPKMDIYFFYLKRRFLETLCRQND